VDGLSLSKSEWSLTSGALAKFLACLDSDRERAGEKYENLRLTLSKFFDWRGARFPEEYADETLNRVIRRIDEGATIQDIAQFCHGVARMVFLEKIKSPDSKSVDIEDVPPATLIAAPERRDDRHECFDSCLKELAPESRQLIIQYYSDEKREKINNRLALARNLDIPLNALRSRAQRIRDRLEQCIRNCMKQNE
jgi:DNA-directed RNA polymerase specialized sigma24 family protein